MNLKIHTKLLLIIAILICCKNISQAANLTSVGNHHIIALSYKKDCILSFGGIKGGEYYNNLTVQTGFAYNDFLAFQAGYHYFSDNPYLLVYNGINYTEFTYGHFAHAAAGVFYPIPIKNFSIERLWKNKDAWYSPRHILLDAYLAYGKGLNMRALEFNYNGTAAATFNNYSSNSTINFNKWYAEGGIHYKGHMFGLSLSGVIGILNFKKITILGLPDDDLVDLIDLLSENINYFTYGYQVKVSYCFDWFTILYHNHVNFIDKQKFMNQDLHDYFGEFSLQVNISRLFKKNKSEE